MYKPPFQKEFFGKAPALLAELKRQPESYWIERGEKNALALFRQTAARVPAYRDFLKKNKIASDAIKTIADFKQVPVTTKDNYLLAYSPAELCWDGRFKEKQWMIASTSGSTGEPFYFPRTKIQDEQFMLTAELAFLDFFEIDKRSTLFLNCFALGVWIGGMFMYQAVRRIVDSGRYPISVLNPGADRAEVLKAIKKLAPLFDQVILGGYGPLVKDLIDEGIRQGIDWKQHNMKYFFAAEGFTEGFREYMEVKGGAQNPLTDTINHYGTADLGTMSHETPVSNLIRRLAVERPAVYDSVFNFGGRVPTFTQYIPELYFFEEVAGRLLCTANGGLPLIRYDLKDVGGTAKFSDIKKKVSAAGVNLSEELTARKVSQAVWNLPFVYLYERNDFTVSIYSVNIYPESIRRALEHRDLQAALTGKFTMRVDFDEEQNQFLEINSEMHPGIIQSETLRKEISEVVIHQLYTENSEWRDFYERPDIQQKVVPRIALWPYQDLTYFKPGGKQKWVKKS